MIGRRRIGLVRELLLYVILMGTFLISLDRCLVRGNVDNGLVLRICYGIVRRKFNVGLRLICMDDV